MDATVGRFEGIDKVRSETSSRFRKRASGTHHESSTSPAGPHQRQVWHAQT
jgi:hypothetical protein